MKLLIVLLSFISLNAFANNQVTIVCQSESTHLIVQGLSFRGNYYLSSGELTYKGLHAVLPQDMDGSFEDRAFDVDAEGAILRLETNGFYTRDFSIQVVGDAESLEIGNCSAGIREL